ncbi:MAG: hypothetical protein GY913_20720 [Proteobacteria bacterium]|nr:hypothetical protein [Pseudomonadota bacterium]
MEIYRWDLDKTYLQTDFESVRGLVRSAMEAPSEKRNVPGSAALLRALSMRERSRVVILSGSPTQMREVLEQKLRLDGVRFHELHLKDTVRNIKRGRLRAIKGQFGYKLPALLKGRAGLGGGVLEHLFGDDAEIDALVYSVFADAVAGRLTPVEVSRIMEAAGAYPDRIKTALDALEGISHTEAVERIFIRLEKGVPPRLFEPLGPRMVPVYSWFQAALVLYGAGRLAAGDVRAVTLEVGRSGQGPRALGNLFQDIVRRGHVELSAMRRLVDELDTTDAHEAVEACRDRVAWLGRVESRYRPPAPPVSIDYLEMLKAFKK